MAREFAKEKGLTMKEVSLDNLSQVILLRIINVPFADATCWRIPGYSHHL